MKPCFSLAALLALTACSSPQTVPPQPAAPTSAAATQPAPVAQDQEFKFGFRDGKTVADARIVRTEESPCGDLPIARVQSIPLNDPVLAADPVVEFDQAGKVVAQWGKPNSAEVLALDGARLKFAVGNNAYWTDATGAIEQAGASPAGQGEEFMTDDGMFPCPALTAFPQDGSQQCFRVRDAAGRQRLIALEGACS